MTAPKQHVLVLTTEQLAALCAGTTAAVIYGLLPVTMLPDVAEAVGAINEAIGNPQGDGYAEAVKLLRAHLEGKA